MIEYCCAIPHHKANAEFPYLPAFACPVSRLHSLIHSMHQETELPHVVSVFLLFVLHLSLQPKGRASRVIGAFTGGEPDAQEP